MGDAFRPNLHFIFPRQIETFINFIASVGEGFSHITIMIIAHCVLVFFDADQFNGNITNLPILVSSVVMACTSAVAYRSPSLFVIGRARVCTLIRRSPAKHSQTPSSNE